MMEKNYYIDKAGKILGPFAIQQIRDLASRGQVAPTDLIRKGTGPWILSVNIKGLIQTSPTTSPTFSNATSSVDDNWYAQVGNQAVGPVPKLVIIDMIKTSKLTPTHLVWKDGMADWKTVSQMPDLLINSSDGPFGNVAVGSDSITGNDRISSNYSSTTGTGLLSKFGFLGLLFLAGGIVSAAILTIVVPNLMDPSKTTNKTSVEIDKNTQIAAGNKKKKIDLNIAKDDNNDLKNKNDMNEPIIEPNAAIALKKNELPKNAKMQNPNRVKAEEIKQKNEPVVAKEQKKPAIDPDKLKAISLRFQLADLYRPYNTEIFLRFEDKFIIATYKKWYDHEKTPIEPFAANKNLSTDQKKLFLRSFYESRSEFESYQTQKDMVKLYSEIGRSLDPGTAEGAINYGLRFIAHRDLLNYYGIIRLFDNE